MTERAGSPAENLTGATFIGREEELTAFRQILRGMGGGKRGFFEGLLGSSPKSSAPPVEQKIKSRLVQIVGSQGLGKTRLTLKMREVANREKEFARRFRVSRLDWAEVTERDQRLAATGFNSAPAADVALDVLYTHFVRDGLEAWFEDYRAAIESTRELAKTVTGAELKAVWEYRAHELGKGMKEASQSDRPLLFMMDNFVADAAFCDLLREIMEYSGGQVVWIVTGQTALPDSLVEQVAPERRLLLQLAPLSDYELRQFFEAELGRYADGELQLTAEDGSDGSEPSDYRSPARIAQLQAVTEGLPLAGRLAAYLLQVGLSVDDLPDGGGAPITYLLEDFIQHGPFSDGHPDRQRLTAMAVLRRPERGLLAEVLDLYQDLVTAQEIVTQQQLRYAFLFEPSREMGLHAAIEQPLLSYLMQPTPRTEEAGLRRINTRAVGYLSDRLREWGQNFSDLASRIRDVKWATWAIDLGWHSFWLSEDEGWEEFLPLFIAGMAYKPAVAGSVIASLEHLATFGQWSNESRARLDFLQTIYSDGPTPADHRSAWKGLHSVSSHYNWYDLRYPHFAAELEKTVEEKMKD